MVAGIGKRLDGVTEPLGTLAKKCDNGPNCFVAGTQVVVATLDRPVVLAEAVADDSSSGAAIAFVGTGLALSVVRQVTTSPAARQDARRTSRRNESSLPDSPTRLF
jgi:hypothetical protein